MKILRWIDRQMRRWGPLGVTAFAAVVVIILALGYFGAKPVVEDATDGPNIPVDLIDHADERAGLERGYQFGAEPAVPMPRPDFISGYQFHASPNFSGRGTCGLEAIVLHVTGPGSLAGMRSWFKNPASQVSAHFGIGKNGELEQYVPLEAAAWHAGILNLPDTSNPLIARWKEQGINPNRCHIGIELLLGGPAEPLVNYPAMEQTLETLLLWLRDVTGIPLDRTHVIGHYQLDAINRSTDPRCCVQIEAVLRELGPPPSQRFVFADGWSYDPANGDWYNPAGEKEWSACNQDRLRWNYIVNRWFPETATGGFDPAPHRNYWSLAGPC